jgi:hypothetical protein
MNKKEYDHKYHLEHKAEISKRHIKWAKNNKERVRAIALKCYYKNRETTTERRHRWAKQLRIKVLESLGNKCVRCGISDPRVLQIDHINGGGRKEAEKTGRNLTYFNKVIKNEHKEYQLLCSNCNWIKKYEKNENIKPRNYLK